MSSSEHRSYCAELEEEGLPPPALAVVPGQASQTASTDSVEKPGAAEGQHGGRLAATLAPEASSGPKALATGQQMCSAIASSIIGEFTPFNTPFGERRLVYADWTASGRALRFLERHVTEDVLPFYGNTHTTTSVSGLQSTCFRHEARQLVAQAVNANSRTDVVLFVGSGATSAISRLVHILGMHLPLPKGHTAADRPVVFVGPHEHHSNLLPWRESCAEVITIGEDSRGQLDITDLESKLKTYSSRQVKIGTFAAASNVTGVLAPVNEVTALLHRYGALSFWDYATAAPYVSVDMNPVIVGENRALVSKDAVFVSPHKFVGGPNTPGLLIAKKSLFSNKEAPAVPGGGTVFYVTENDHRYLSNREEREEGGTPDIVGSIRAGLVFHLKSRVGVPFIEEKEASLWARARDVLSKEPGIVLLGSLDAPRLPILSFLVRCGGKFLHYNYVCSLLNDLYGIQSRGGCQCAGPYSQKLLGMSTETTKLFENALLEKKEFLRPGFTRLSLTYFMETETVDYILKAIVAVARFGWRLMPFYRFNHKTGEWKHHSRMTRFTDRIWSSQIAFDHLSGSGEGGVPAPRFGGGLQGCHSQAMKNWMAKTEKEALNIMMSMSTDGEPNSSSAATSSSSEQSGSNPDALLFGAEQLRWCIFPAEVVAALKSGNNLCPLPSHFEGKESDVVLQSTKVPTPPHRSVNKIAIEPTRYNKNVANDSGVVATSKKRPLSDMAQSSPASQSPKRAGDSSETCSIRPQKKTKFMLRDARTTAPAQAKDRMLQLSSQATKMQTASVGAKLFPKVPKKLLRSVGKAMMDWNMVQDGDRVLLGLSGGKDSLALLHILHALQKRSPVKWDLGAVTVDPGTDAYDPSPLIPYLKSLGIPYFFLSERIIDRAKVQMQGDSICSFCSRMKRGALYSCARKNGYNVLALGQHLDDLAESFIMSALHNGQVRTMKAHYTNNEGDVRIIRPMIYVREAETKKFSYDACLPVINESCPACFEGPKERHRVKKLLAQEESLFPGMFGNMRNAMLPLMDAEYYEMTQKLRERVSKRNAGKEKNRDRRDGDAAPKDGKN